MVIRRKIQRVIDGDTFKVRRRVQGSQTIRIAGMDAPEKGESGYAAAKNRLARLNGQTVTLIPKGRSYGRVVAEVRHKRKKLR